MLNLPNPTASFRQWLPPALLAVVSICIFWPSMGHEFLINWDDLQYVTDNPVIQGFTPQHIKDAFSKIFVGNYAPLHIISYMLDFHIWGLRSSGFIMTNILLHTANGLLFYQLLNRMAAGYLWPFFAALLFLLHPVQVESVVWISQRKNVLAMFFFLASFLAYLRYRDSGRMHRGIFYLLSLFAFCLSMLSKSAAVILPAALLLHDHCFIKKQDLKQLLLDKIPYIVISAVFAAVAIQSHSAQTLGGGTSYHGGTPFSTFLTMLPIIISYLRMIVWPSGLSAFYDPPIKTEIDLHVAGAAILCIVMVAAGTYLYRHRRGSFFWFALFFIGLLPVLQIVPIVTLMNDRYLYFPMLGAAPLLAFSVLDNLSWSDLSTGIRSKALTVACILALALLAVATSRRIPVWHDSYSLWKDTVTRAPNVPLVHDGFGESLLQRGQLEEAIGQFMVSLQLQPDSSTPGLSVGKRNALANTLNNLGTAYGMKGMTDLAIRHFTEVVRLDPGFDKAHFNLGNALANSGKFEKALSSFEEAFRLNPSNSTYRKNLELTRELIGKGVSTEP